MDKQVAELKQALDSHIVESGYYRNSVSKNQEETKNALEELSKKMDDLLEVYTAANFLKKFVIGLMGVAGTVTAIIYSWLHILKKS